MSTNENVLEREGFERPNVKEDNNKIVDCLSVCRRVWFES